jgi:hypothetical protein
LQLALWLERVNIFYTTFRQFSHVISYNIDKYFHKEIKKREGREEKETEEDRKMDGRRLSVC